LKSTISGVYIYAQIPLSKQVLLMICDEIGDSVCAAGANKILAITEKAEDLFEQNKLC
jgi:hypothetical protein